MTPELARVNRCASDLAQARRDLDEAREDERSCERVFWIVVGIAIAIG